VALAFTAIVAVGAQAPAVKRTVLQQGDLSVAGREAVMALAELPQGGATGRHTHPGEEISYVLEGSVIIEVDGKPAMTKKAGEVFMIPAGTVHNAHNKGAGAAKVIATYVIEKGKPVTTPVK
jgi:quercetin dioxygenase-like cupin family protein